VHERTRRGLQATALAVAATIAVCGAVELAVRLAGVAPPLPAQYVDYVADDALPFRMAANSVRRNRPWPSGDEFQFEFRTNSQGFPDVEHAFEKSPGVFRILGLGDSYTAGGGAPFEDTYLYRLEQMLRADGRDVEIVKAGQPRYWTEPERILLETVGVRYRPDLVMVAVTPNDVTDTFLGASDTMVRDGWLVSREAYALGSTALRLYVHSHAARILLRAWLDRRAAPSGRGTHATMRWTDVFVADGFHEPDWLAVERELDAMRRITGSIGARMVLIYIPTQDFQRSNAHYPAERLAAWGRRHDVPFIDTLPALRRAAAREQVYWKQDIHCTPAGYRVIAETVFTALTQQDLVAKRSR
jgi:lysophospholipase L1-like esterase